VVVNNNAAALFLLLREFADCREVIVSRGELVQIGGGFRIPEILTNAGASLHEVGTTNITTLDDYRSAVGESTALVLKVHRSNFHMNGFVGSPDIAELCRLKSDKVLVASDLGSGNLVPYIAGSVVGEPTPSDHISAGADLVCFSCDKMLGGVQAGVIAGRADLVDRLRQNPVMRVVRVDKMTYAGLQTALTWHLNGEHEKIQLWAMAAQKREDVKSRVLRFIQERGFDPGVFTAVDCESTFGGGSTPGHKIPSAAIRINMKAAPDDIASALQKLTLPVIGVVREGRFEIDFRTVLSFQEDILARSLKWLMENQK
jgi:L-seryl-tRNA(Ser) seleniumtransferase